jgi:signal transduction histidine kinase
VLDVVQFLAGEAKVRQAIISVDAAPCALIVMGDRIQLQQVLINLILNSMDAMSDVPNVQRAISIVTRLADSTHAEVVVADTGFGFSENIEHVFESFFTTKPQGMGMGLSITASIIHAHDGKIWAENGVDSGAETGVACGAIVHFTLPLHTGETT